MSDAAATAPAPRGDDPRTLAKVHFRNRKLRDQLDALAKANATLTTERDALKGEVRSLAEKADSSAAGKKVEELTAQLRGLKHRQVFDRIAGKLGARPEAVEDLWSLSGYRPEADAADEAAIESLLKDQQARRGYLFKPAGDAAAAGPEAAKDGGKAPEPKSDPGPGASRGGLLKGTGKFAVSRQDIRNAEWMRKNQGAFAKALAEDNVEYID